MSEDSTCLIEIFEPRFDLKASQPLEKNFRELLETENICKVAINFEKVKYMTTSGIGTILSIYHLCSKSELELIIYNLNDELKELLDTTMVSEVINIQN
jgi:anti-anti-sigma factor